MTKITFDTLAFANTLKAAGVDPEQAEAQARAQVNLMAELVDNKLATKDDVQGIMLVVNRLENDFAGLQHNVSALQQTVHQVELTVHKVELTVHQLEHTVSGLESKLIIKLGSIMLLGIGALATLQTIFHH